MSLWHKPISDITFADVEAFCLTQQPEGVRLDYKASPPPDLANHFAAFANTLGGLILLGIKADKATGIPYWPPSRRGMPSALNIEETLVAIARDRPYPPVQLEVSPILDNPHLPGHCMVVVRVPMSPEAPHTVEGRKVYERTGSISKAYDLAHIDRIEYLFNRRSKLDEERESTRASAIERVRHYISPQLRPTIWLSIAPLYPWRPLCRPSDCHAHLRRQKGEEFVQRIQNGAIYIPESMVMPLSDPVTFETITCDARGYFLHLRAITGIHGAPGGYRLVDRNELNGNTYRIGSMRDRFEWMFAEAREFFGQDTLEQPGLLSVRIGMIEIKGTKVFDPNQHREPKPFLDAHYRDEQILTLGELLDEEKGAQPLFDRLAYAFDVATPAGL